MSESLTVIATGEVGRKEIDCGRWEDVQKPSRLTKIVRRKDVQKEPGAIHETKFDKRGGDVQVLVAVTPHLIQRLAKDAAICVYAVNLITVLCKFQTPTYK